ncbi:hypothetical protein HDV06_006166 [Boothiomyces sp. JEL0866]|nr:hypothetical protein HDV06_006166 [Boothiomyces sp. JEL0866]
MCVTDIKRRANPLEPKTYMSKATIQERVDKGETLIIIHNKVYNMTKWLPYHPGGELALQHMAGRDATDAMIVLHPEWAMNKIHSFYIADLDPLDIEDSEISKDFRKLNNKLKEMGLYKSKPIFWIKENLKFLALLGLMIYFCVYGTNNYMYLFSAFCASQLWHQAAFVAHDTGHSGVTSNRTVDSLYGILLAGIAGGLSMGWWKHSHYVHHIITNHPEHDPDIQHLPFFAVTKRFTEGLYSTFHKRKLTFDDWAKTLVPHQHKLYHIVLMFGRFNLYVQSWLFVMFHRSVFYRNLEIVSMTIFWVWYSYMLSYLPSWYHILGYVLVSHMLTMVLHLQITLSHFGMSTDIPNASETFAELGLRTSMDVDCPEWLDWLHGGLQFQVEHHLFPRLPRHNLRQVQPLVKEFAKKHDLAFHSYTFTKANTNVLGAMEDVANQIKAIINADINNVH